MTDGSGHRSRLTGVALLTPAAAALFAGILAWATAHQPAVPPVTAAGSPSAGPGTTSNDRLRQEREVRRLREQISSLRDRLAALPEGNHDRASGSGSSSSSSRRPGTAGGAAQTAKPKRAGTTPPPVQATTGAS